jgi:3-methyladenine DNA glycosylase AlkD
MPHPMVLQLNEELIKAGDPDKAKGMQAYMKTTQPFYGVPAGPRRKSFKLVAKNFKNLTHQEYEQIIFELWNGEYHEEMYQALEVAQHYKAHHNLESWPIYDRLVKSATNWDTLDWIAGRLVSPLVVRHRALESKLIEWSRSDNFWVRRAALISHLHHKEKTNTDLLASTILALAHEKEFFIRKAIGWVLRDYSYTNPTWVEAFIEKHRDKLSGLSKREALKQINRGR